MTTTEAPNIPDTTPDTRMDRAAATPLTTYRIVIEETGRALLQGFHIETSFTDAPAKNSLVAEISDAETAFKIIRLLRYRAPLVVKAEQWDHVGGIEIERLCRRVADTGAHAAMLFWNPMHPDARAHLGMRKGGRR